MVNDNVAAMLQARAVAEPDGIVVVDEHGPITLGELDALTGTFARLLTERVGVRTHPTAAAGSPPLPIVVGADRWSLVALLGAVRAGIPHAPLPSDQPAARLEALLDRLGRPSVALVDPAFPGRLPDGVEVLRPALVPDDPIAPCAVEDPEAVACVLFTSGSTGRPKGVVYEWRNLAWMAASSLGDPGSHWGSVLPFHWAGGYFNVVRAAATATLSIVPPGLTNAERLLDWYDRGSVEIVSIPPSMLAQLVDRWPEGRRLEQVRQVRIGGEKLGWEIVPAVRRLVTERAVINFSYGSTEGGTVAVCRMIIGPDDEVGVGPIPIGRWEEPGRGRLEPVAGGDDLAEIVVTGKIARGYWDDPEEHRARFGHDPDGTRILRTGDLARVGDDGLIQLVGRADDLVKIRGIRVEPAEVELAFHAIPGVREAVVLPHESERGIRLVGHLVLDDPDLSADVVRHTLSERLPPHLVPSPLVVHDALPTLPNGKVDRRALRSAPVEPWRAAPPRPPADALEADVLVMCAEALELDEVGADDDLWEIGLDSLRAVELAAAISELGWGPFDPSLPLQQVSAAAIAEVLRRGAADEDPHRPSEVVTLVPVSSGDHTPIVAVPGAGATASAYFWLARVLGPEQPFTVDEAHGLHTPGRPDRSVAAAARRTARRVADVHADGPVLLVGHSAGGAVAYEAGRLLHAAGRDVRVAVLDLVPSTLRPASGGPVPPAPVGAARGRRTRGPGRLPHLLRRAVDEGRVRFRALRPGPPSRSLMRFRAFTLIGTRAVRRYQPGPATFPLLVVHTEATTGAAWAGVAPDLTVAATTGSHLSMLRPPHVRHTADALRSLV